MFSTKPTISLDSLNFLPRTFEVSLRSLKKDSSNLTMEFWLEKLVHHIVIFGSQMHVYSTSILHYPIINLMNWFIFNENDITLNILYYDNNMSLLAEVKRSCKPSCIKLLNSQMCHFSRGAFWYRWRVVLCLRTFSKPRSVQRLNIQPRKNLCRNE